MLMVSSLGIVGMQSIDAVQCSPGFVAADVDVAAAVAAPPSMKVQHLQHPQSLRTQYVQLLHHPLSRSLQGQLKWEE